MSKLKELLLKIIYLITPSILYMTSTRIKRCLYICCGGVVHFVARQQEGIDRILKNVIPDSVSYLLCDFRQVKWPL